MGVRLLTGSLVLAALLYVGLLAYAAMHKPKQAAELALLRKRNE